MPIFCVKSVKIYTGQKKFARTSSVRPWQISGMIITIIIVIIMRKNIKIIMTINLISLLLTEWCIFHLIDFLGFHCCFLGSYTNQLSEQLLSLLLGVTINIYHHRHYHHCVHHHSQQQHCCFLGSYTYQLEQLMRATQTCCWEWQSTDIIIIAILIPHTHHPHHHHYHHHLDNLEQHHRTVQSTFEYPGVSSLALMASIILSNFLGSSLAFFSNSIFLMFQYTEC